MSVRVSAQRFTRGLTVVSVALGAALLGGCGQRGALYMPGSTPPQSKHAHFIFGSDTAKTNSSVTTVIKPKTTVSPTGAARPYVPGPITGDLRDDPTVGNGSNGSPVTVGPAVGSAS